MATIARALGLAARRSAEAPLARVIWRWMATAIARAPPLDAARRAVDAGGRGRARAGVHVDNLRAGILVVLHHGEAGRIVAAVFEAREPAQQDAARLLLAEVGDDAALANTRRAEEENKREVAAEN